MLGSTRTNARWNSVNRGESYILDITNRTAGASGSERVWCLPRLIFPAVRDVQAVSICVPTPLRKTGDPDLSFIVSATESITPYLHPGMVIVLESSTYPGTTRELVFPRLLENRILRWARIFSWHFLLKGLIRDERILQLTTLPRSSEE